jgi:hypothetical protein
MYSLVPKNATVFSQNDIPQLSYAKKIYMPGFGIYHNQTVDYAVLNPLEFNSISTPFNGFSEKWAYYFSTNSSYGIYASVDGSVLYKLGYRGQPAYYVPINAVTKSGFTISLEPNVTVPSPSIAEIYSPPAILNASFHVNASSPLPQNSLRLLIESSSHNINITEPLKIYRIDGNLHSYFLTCNFAISFYDDWSFYILGSVGSYTNVTLVSGNVTETNPL